ncbi:MAG: hypothetical protein GVY08_02375 [Bacteroidetes bacterium]|jgi:hypothetical protein|nr:hypothetical protein [Bacteroidota bacterium]
MSNQLKTLSKSQLESLISGAVSSYLSEDVQCDVSVLDTPNIDDEDKVEHNNKRTLYLEANLSYHETDHV